ncbi:MAG TPA: tryptophan--tRNA ligase [Candidatus Atribacteria bacterium]|nr:tryptophan--tRNA ligase [Candidatus Atribacteria bacterium]HCU22963.1 tryptophan--tRNA ligase [Candidatus Atribacteria bacterium]
MGNKDRIFSGMRPTGKMHIGHYLGALKNWLQLQKEYDCIFGIVDWHALTTSFEHTEDIERNIIDMAVDWFSVGIDPEVCIPMIQSLVPEHAELHLLLSMVTPLGWLERNPVLKQQLQDMGLKEAVGYGHLGYPVLMAADIIIYQGIKVPVGEDQVPHIEIAREMVRRFHYLYQQEVFKEPQPLLTETPRILGIDGKKMSKSLNNAIGLSDTKEELRAKVLSMFTDPEKVRKRDPGHPERCNVFSFHNIVGNPRIEPIEEDCRTGDLGCVDCKKELLGYMVDYLEEITPFRERYQGKDHLVKDILVEGSRKAQTLARETMQKVREAMHIAYQIPR